MTVRDLIPWSRQENRLPAPVNAERDGAPGLLEVSPGQETGRENCLLLRLHRYRQRQLWTSRSRRGQRLPRMPR